MFLPGQQSLQIRRFNTPGFGYCPFFSISGTGLSKEYAEKFIQELVSTAANLHLPIDGIVMIFDSLSYSKVRKNRTPHKERPRL